jgi:hypothetical protein
MGCFDVYCVICSCPPTSADILEIYCNDTNIERIENDKKPFDIDDIKNFVKKTIHLSQCTFLTENNEIIHNCYENSGCGSFKDQNNNNYGLLLHKGDNKKNFKYGLFLHTDCWEYIKNKYNISLCFSDIKHKIIKDLENNLFVKINYGGIINKYIMGQYMDFEKLFEDDNLYLCYTPLEYDEKNNKRIDSVIDQVVIL